MHGASTDFNVTLLLENCIAILLYTELAFRKELQILVVIFIFYDFMNFDINFRTLKGGFHGQPIRNYLDVHEFHIEIIANQEKTI